MVLKVAARIAFAGAMAALSVACYVDASSSGTYASGGGNGPSGPAPTPTGASSEPMLVEVDTNKTMAAAPGDGVGVFVEYAAGGKWHVWWTCDTNQTRQACGFDVKVSAASGTIAGTTSEAFGPSDALSTPSSERIHAVTTTTTKVSGVSFETTPGAAILLEAAVSGLQESGFLFFVQDGKVNGGFPGKLTNPLLLRGKTP